MYQIIKIVSTILVVVMSILDFVKAMGSQDSNKMKQNINKVKKRVIIVVILLFAPTIIDFLLGLFSNGAWSTCGIK